MLMTITITITITTTTTSTKHMYLWMNEWMNEWKWKRKRKRSSSYYYFSLFSIFFFSFCFLNTRTNGNVNELQNVGESPRKSSLFFLTILKLYGVTTLESDQPEIGLNGWKSALSLEASSVFSTILENWREWTKSKLLSSGRTHNRSRSPRLIASSQ